MGMCTSGRVIRVNPSGMFTSGRVVKVNPRGDVYFRKSYKG